jgi:hypothetical protein
LLLLLLRRRIEDGGGAGDRRVTERTGSAASRRTTKRRRRNHTGPVLNVDVLTVRCATMTESIGLYPAVQYVNVTSGSFNVRFDNVSAANGSRSRVSCDSGARRCPVAPEAFVVVAEQSIFSRQAIGIVQKSMRGIAVLLVVPGLLLLQLNDLLVRLELMRMQMMVLYVSVVVIVNAVRLTVQVAQRIRFRRMHHHPSIRWAAAAGGRRSLAATGPRSALARSLYRFVGVETARLYRHRRRSITITFIIIIIIISHRSVPYRCPLYFAAAAVDAR